jgi:hypothetical protein
MRISFREFCFSLGLRFVNGTCFNAYMVLSLLLRVTLYTQPYEPLPRSDMILKFERNEDEGASMFDGVVNVDVDNEDVILFYLVLVIYYNKQYIK